ncbi:leucyl aminopeptidase [Amylibacter sp.]|nr:leucyl aminopeptidase [Amylibacter sp.]
MTRPIHPTFKEHSLQSIADAKGLVVICADAAGSFGPSAKRVNRLMKGALRKFADSDFFEKMEEGDVQRFPAPLGLSANAVLLLKMKKRPSIEVAQKCGANIAKESGKSDINLFVTANARAAHLSFGITMRRYNFNEYKTNNQTEFGELNVYITNVSKTLDEYSDLSAVVDGVFFTRDLVNEPANVLTTTEFANRLQGLEELGLKINVLEESDMEALGMFSLLGVGMGSESPSKIVTMEWSGGGNERPFALVGKGVVFDTGGISLKPAGGMEDMTMDMGGAGVVAGVMKTLALRKAKANIIGLVGLVENMPDAKAQRPGDVVKSMKGETIEVINTDAEGRLVLADVLWYAQKKYKPSGIINLATLTGAVIVALGHENAGVFSNNDKLVNDFLKSANLEAEGAWRMPLNKNYDKLIQSRIADIKNVGGRTAGSITAAQFLQRFIEDDMPWVHLDIAGVASVKSETDFAPKGATGWGVRSLNRLISDIYEL